MKTSLVTGLALPLLLAASSALAQNDDRYDADKALAISQAAIGRALGNHQLTDVDGAVVNLRDDYAGRPLVISMIFTSCHHVCPMTTKHLATAVLAAREALGDDSFDVVTIGFDVANDTPEALRGFARTQGVSIDRWRFLSATPQNIEQISRDLGFIFFPTPRGFDHLNQATIIDRNGIVYGQVYGVTFELPWLVEPLKQLVFNRPESGGHLIAGLVDRIKLFCTVYDPGTGRYEFDRSLFFSIFAGFTIILSVTIYLIREIRSARRSRHS